MDRNVFLDNIKKTIKFFCIILIGTVLILPVQESGAQGLAEERIAVMPFIKGKNPDTVEETITCPYSSLCFDEQSMKAGADKTLTRMLQSMLEKDFGGRVVPLAQAATAFEIIKIDHVKDTPKTVLLNLGNSLNADYMMAGSVWRYSERVGTSFSVEKPASVAFAVYLVDMKTKKVIWQGSYDETQQALTENLFNVKDFFKQGAQWLTADELARFGMEKIFKDFPVKP